MRNIFRLPFDLIWVSFDVVRRPKLFAICLIPAGIGVASFLTYAGVVVWYRYQLASLLLSQGPEWMSTVLVWLLLLVGVFLAAMLALLTMVLAGGFFIEQFIETLLRERGLLPSASSSLLNIAASFLRALRTDLLILTSVGVITLIGLLAGIFPALFLIPLVLGVFVAGYNVIDLPLALMEHGFRERLRVALQHKLELCALGAVFSLLLVFPLGAVIFLPPMYYVGVLWIARWVKAGEGG